MFVGHALVAFALAGLLAERAGVSRALALRIGIVAGLFAALPDADVVYGLVGLLDAGIDPESFWAAGNRVHRGVTHSLVVGALVAGAVTPIARPEPLVRAGGVLALGTIVALVAVVSGPLGGVIGALFALGALAVAALALRWSLPPVAVGGAALIGLLSHPFGDLFTGTPPALLYPFDVTVVADRVALSADPTLQLLGAFWVELGVVWLALLVAFRLTDRRLAAYVDRRAALGVGYATAAVALPAPTLEVSYHFVFSVLAVGTVGAAPTSFDPTLSPTEIATPRAVATAVAAVTVASLAYAAAYAVL